MNVIDDVPDSIYSTITSNIQKGVAVLSIG